MKDQLLQAYRRNDSIDNIKKQIEIFVYDDAFQDIPKLFSDFYTAIYLHDKGKNEYCNIATPMGLYCVLMNVKSIFELGQQEIDQLQFIRNHLNVCFLWEYKKLVWHLGSLFNKQDCIDYEYIPEPVTPKNIRVYIEKAHNHIFKMVHQQCQSSMLFKTAKEKTEQFNPGYIGVEFTGRL